MYGTMDPSLQLAFLPFSHVYTFTHLIGFVFFSFNGTSLRWGKQTRAEKWSNWPIKLFYQSGSTTQTSKYLAIWERKKPQKLKNSSTSLYPIIKLKPRLGHIKVPWIDNSNLYQIATCKLLAWLALTGWFLGFVCLWSTAIWANNAAIDCIYWGLMYHIGDCCILLGTAVFYWRPPMARGKWPICVPIGRCNST